MPDACDRSTPGYELSAPRTRGHGPGRPSPKMPCDVSITPTAGGRTVAPGALRTYCPHSTLNQRAGADARHGREQTAMPGAELSLPEQDIPKGQDHRDDDEHDEHERGDDGAVLVKDAITVFSIGRWLLDCLVMSLNSWHGHGC